MTVLDPKSTRIVIADGFSTFYPFGFTLTDNFALFVAIDGEDPGKYKISDTGITFTSPPPRGARIVIQRLTELTQLIDWMAFDEFEAQDTEDATDKLIILKEEAIAFRAGLNLVTVRRVGTVTIVSDKGEDAEFSLWGPEMAGFYNALASAQNMPVPGTVVEKPEQFMYWQWDSGMVEPPDPTVLVLTSSPYPYFLFETVQVNQTTVEQSRLLDLPREQVAAQFAMLDSTLRTLLSEYTQPPEWVEAAFGMADGTFRTLLQEYDAGVESVTLTQLGMDDGTIRTLLVTNVAPTERVQATFGMADSTLETP